MSTLLTFRMAQDDMPAKCQSCDGGMMVRPEKIIHADGSVTANR